jgi:hypothetical protein
MSESIATIETGMTLPAARAPYVGRISTSLIHSQIRQHLAAALLLAVLPFVVYAPLWMPYGRITLGMDYPDFQPGQQLLFLQHLRDGFFPLWAPGDAGGIPFAAYFIAQQYSPLTWMLAAFDATYQGLQLDLLTLQRLTLLGMSAFFTYLVVRRLGLGWLPGLAAGAIGVFNMRMLDCFRYGSALDAAVWLPVLVYLADRIADRPSLRLIVLYALAQHMLIVSGHTQNAFYAAGFTFAWFLLRTWLLRPAPTERLRRWLPARIGCMVAGQILGLALTAALLIPMVAEMMPLWTKRTLGGAAYYYEVHMTWPDLLANLFFPWLADIHSGFYWSQAGWILLVGLMVTLIVHRRNLPPQHVRLLIFLLAVLTFCLLYSLGPLTPIGPLVNAVVPGLKTFRAPGRIMIVGSLAAGLLVAFAIDYLLTNSPARRTLIRVGLAAGLLYLVAGVLLLAVWAADLARWGEIVNYTRQLWLPVLGHITENAPIRIHSLTGMIPGMAALILAVTLLNLVSFTLCRSGRLPAAALVLTLGVGALLETAVYHRRGTYIIPGRYYTSRSDRFKDVDVYHTRIFDRLSMFTYAKRNVLKQVHEPGQMRFKFDLPGPLCEFLAEGGPPAWRIYYQNVSGHEIPRAYVTPYTRPVRGNDLAGVRDLDPYRASVIDLNDPANASAAADSTLAHLAAEPGATNTDTSKKIFDQLNTHTRVVGYTPNRASFLVATDRPALFNYNDTWTPGWQAQLDGSPAPLYRVNHLFKGLALPPGSHRIDFVYDPPDMRIALTTSLSAACLWLSLAGMSLLSRPAARISLAVLILAASSFAAVGLYHRTYAMAHRDGLIQYNPNTPRPLAPDYDQYLNSPPTTP